MNGTDIPMKEFLLWSNCANNCKFCWQKKLAKPEMWLTEEEKLQSIEACKKEIAALPYTDILIVGGEVYNVHSEPVNKALIDLFNYIADRVREGLTRQLYANSNMIHKDTRILEALIKSFTGIEDKLRLTTSYDIYGRFGLDSDRALFLLNLSNITLKYPKVSILVNTILTKQACDAILSGSFDVEEFSRKYRVAAVNLIPYIPISPDDEMVATPDEIFQTLTYVGGKSPHYHNYYVKQMDFRQPRVLKEFHKSEGYVECTSKYLECGHNENYLRPLNTGECFCCAISKLLDNQAILTDDLARQFVKEGRKIFTIGDMTSSYIWTNFKQPDLVVFDNKAKAENFESVLSLVRKTNTKRIIITGEEVAFDRNGAGKLEAAIQGMKDEPLAVQIIGEEDFALFTVRRCAPDNAIVAFGDPQNKCIYYSVGPW